MTNDFRPVPGLGVVCSTCGGAGSTEEVFDSGSVDDRGAPITVVSKVPCVKCKGMGTLPVTSNIPGLFNIPVRKNGTMSDVLGKTVSGIVYKSTEGLTLTFTDGTVLCVYPTAQFRIIVNKS